MRNSIRKTVIVEASRLGRSPFLFLLSLLLLLSPPTLLTASGVTRRAIMPVITATKVDSFADLNMDGKAEPGATITYTVTITNTGTTDATDVVFNDTVDPNTTFVPGSAVPASWNIGTLPANDSVTINFDVVVNNPYSGGPNISNQGTVSGSNFANVLTDDPDVGGAANPTVTPINVPNGINILARDGKAPEPPSGTSLILFTIVLSAPATADFNVTYATADGTATGGNSCAGSADFETTADTITFFAGEQIKTVSINICSDAASESDETLLLNVTGSTGATILDNQAVGTITAANPVGVFLVSELRTSGPGGTGDDFVELYNNTNAQLTVAASDASAGYGLFKMGSSCDATPVLIGTIPNGTVIPARGHFLFVGSAYGLGAYATGDATLTANIDDDRNVAVFSTADVTNISSVTRLDSVGFNGNTGSGVCDLLREGNTLGAVSGSTTQHSFFRKECDYVAGVGCTVAGTPKDTNNNAADFLFADTQGTSTGAGQRLGAPGPENLSSPILRDATVNATLLDNTKSASGVPNRLRDLTSNPGNNSTFGTLSIRRRIVNNTGANVTRLRFRIIEITTSPTPGGGVADLRAITSSAVSVSGIADASTCLASTGASTTPCTVTVQGTTLEQPPSQPNGGGYNSTLAAGTITTTTTLAPGASVNVQFLLGVQTSGTFRFLVITEALP
jgi:uncharacterized repeat protein (TIGR01451 family)